MASALPPVLAPHGRIAPCNGQVEAHDDDPGLLNLTVDSVLRIRNFRDASNSKICDFVRAMLYAVGKDRMAINTFHTWTLWYGMRMWASEYYGKNMSGMRYDDDKEGHFRDTLVDWEFFMGARNLQIMRGPGLNGMVRNGTFQRGQFSWSDFTQSDQRERILLPWMPPDRTLRERVAAEKTKAPTPMPGTTYEAVAALTETLLPEGEDKRRPAVPAEVRVRQAAAFPQRPARFQFKVKLPPPQQQT